MGLHVRAEIILTRDFKTDPKGKIYFFSQNPVSLLIWDSIISMPTYAQGSQYIFVGICHFSLSYWYIVVHGDSKRGSRNAQRRCCILWNEVSCFRFWGLVRQLYVFTNETDKISLKLVIFLLRQLLQLKTGTCTQRSRANGTSQYGIPNQAWEKMTETLST